jgi:hypothetical protein
MNGLDAFPWTYTISTHLAEKQQHPSLGFPDGLGTTPSNHEDLKLIWGREATIY